MNEIIKQDYFKLIRDLNKSNRVENKSTKLIFVIEDNKFYAKLSKDQKVLLCESRKKQWLTSNYSLYPMLADYIADFLNENQITADLTKMIRLSIFQMPD